MLETKSFRYVIGADGANLAFVCTATGENYCKPQPATAFARALVEGQWRRAASVAADGDRIAVTFADTPATATLAVTAHARHLVLKVVATSDDVEELQLANVPLTLRGTLEEPFAACVLHRQSDPVGNAGSRSGPCLRRGVHVGRGPFRRGRRGPRARKH